jgi:S-formylglutathione hydrolase FrmB
MKKFVLTLLVALCAWWAQAQQLVVISSPHLHADDSVLVFIPEQYASSYEAEYCVECCGDPDPVPALFLLHGWSGCYRNWADKSDLQAIANESGFIIICPDGFYDSWYVNGKNPEDMQWRDFFDKELYPQIMEKYFLTPEKTFITGLSMGGHGAINLFLDYTSRFRGAGSMSGVLDLNAEKGRLGLDRLLGPYGPENPRHDEESAIHRIERAKGTDKLMVISCGYSDSLYPCNRAFCERCKELGVPYVELYSPGVHSWKYWDYALRLHLWYFSRIVNGENLGY